MPKTERIRDGRRPDDWAVADRSRRTDLVDDLAAIVQFVLIVLAVLLAPVYAAWLLGGRIADKRGQAKVKL